MPAQISQARGDINLVKLEDLENGQLFWARKNTVAASSGGHTWSEGQLYIKQGGSLIKITSTRSNNTLKLTGIISEAFNGDFINAPEDSLYRRCQEGDVFLFESVKDSEHWKYKFKKGDFLIITEAIYEPIEESFYRDTLKSVDYIRVPSSFFDKENSDLDATDLSDAIKELEIRLNYKGEIFNNEGIYTAEKKKGNLYLLKADLIFTSDQVVLAKNNGRDYLGNYVKGRFGDFVFWNGKNWTLIPTGLVAADVPYSPSADDIEGVVTFEEFHKNQLKKATNIQEAIDILNINKAPLNEYGKIPFSVLPTSVTTGLSFKEKFYPVTDPLKDPNDPNNQNAYPTPVDENGILLDSYMSGWFYIVDCEGCQNVQYVDSLTGNVVELNTGDWLVWNGNAGHNHFEVIDNSDRVTAIEVTTASGEKVVVLGNIGLESKSKDISLTINDTNTIVLDLAGDAAFLGEKGKVNHLSKFGSEKELVNTEVIEHDGRLEIGDDTIVGKKDASKNLEVFGNAKIGWSTGTSPSSYVNHYLEFSSLLADGEIERSTKLKASTEGEDTDASVVLPDTDSYLIYKHAVDKLEANYLTKVNGGNSITDSFVKETLGDVNIGQGQTTSEKVRSAVVSLYGESNDEFEGGFYEVLHEINDPKSDLKSSIEKFLQENSTHTDLSINPWVLDQKTNTHVTMPRVSGTLITFHEILNLMGDRVGEDLMLPSWRLDYDSNGEIVLGLGRTPVRTRINEVKSGLGTQDRSNDLNKDYGEGRLKTTWSYKMSDKEGSTQEGRPEFEKNDLLTFDAWLDVQRSVASKEAFILPSTALRDTSRFADPRNPDFEMKDPAGDTIDYTNSGKAFHSRFVPSKTVFPNDAAYFDVFGKEIPQEVAKTFELPAESGVLATHNSLMRAPTYR